MSKVQININGRIYAVACDPGEEARVRDLADMVDTRMRKLAGPGSAVGETHLLVLAGLMLADELMEAKAGVVRSDLAPAPVQQPDPPDQNDDLLVEAVDHLADRIAVIADRLARA
jgi:cell division protein ZapA